MKWVYSDGGRFAAGYKCHVGDYACRALSIATGHSYRDVQSKLKKLDPINPRGRGGYRDYLRYCGWGWIPTEEVYFSAEELPIGRLVVQIEKHIAAVIDGVLFDTFDSSREGTILIEGYWVQPSSAESAERKRAFILKN